MEITSIIVALLVIAAAWAVYLLPVVFSDRRGASLSSTEEFDRWSHSMANVQRQSAADLAASHRDVIRTRRRRTLSALVGLTVLSFSLAGYLGSFPWLLAGFFFGSLIGLYVAMLHQMKQRREQRLKITHVSERPTEWEEPQVRVVAN